MRRQKIHFNQLAACGDNRFLLACNRRDEDGIRPFGLIEFRNRHWSKQEINEPIWSVAYSSSIGLAQPRRIALLKFEKQLLIDGGFETLPDPRNADGNRLTGALREVRQIGAHLFVCGAEGQIYRRDSDGWRLLRDDLLVSRYESHPDKMYMAMGGAHEAEIYIGHWRGCDFCNGREIVRLPGVPSAVTGIFVESESRIWLCGWHGLLMCGNHRDGFRAAVADPIDVSYETITGFDGRIWLTTASELYALERATLVRMRPDIERLFRVDQAGGVLWTIGRYDILRFDGTKWEEIAFDPPWANESSK